jgi:hypothetical protein
MAEHYLQTGDKEWFQKNRARITAAADWILRQHTGYLKDLPGREKLAVAGLQHPQVLGVYLNGSFWRWYIMNDAFSVQGLRRFAGALEDFDPEAANLYRTKPMLMPRRFSALSIWKSHFAQCEWLGMEPTAAPFRPRRMRGEQRFGILQ